ncbi:hypothetical protein [Candidatus Synchoanobacter obligatus]|uniref:Uncharacterized protein n=1 Tax=Candidatus Synchoanobacter obligatus TaxID=2919597 RepID=A0ABT1L656_9GAMM|nr:hypothetical protein [Candidatus Synchoanobacter obligatus]MCP8352396.1 hypothetical protein [Candidatus Synchoanobacter obligatus]
MEIIIAPQGNDSVIAEQGNNAYYIPMAQDLTTTNSSTHKGSLEERAKKWAATERNNRANGQQGPSNNPEPSGLSNSRVSKTFL